jgi:hypothetical protein
MQKLLFHLQNQPVSGRKYSKNGSRYFIVGGLLKLQINSCCEKPGFSRSLLHFFQQQMYHKNDAVGIYCTVKSLPSCPS